MPTPATTTTTTTIKAPETKSLSMPARTTTMIIMPATTTTLATPATKTKIATSATATTNYKDSINNMNNKGKQRTTINLASDCFLHALATMKDVFLTYWQFVNQERLIV